MPRPPPSLRLRVVKKNARLHVFWPVVLGTGFFCHFFQELLLLITTFCLRRQSVDLIDWSQYLSGTSALCQHGAFSHFFRLFSTFGVMHQNVVTLGGVCVCFSKSVGKRRFRNVWVGGGRWSQFCAPSCTREDTQGTGNGPGITHYSESDSLSSLPLSARAGTPVVSFAGQP